MIVVHPKIEPGVIDDVMIKTCIHHYGPTGEAGRLFAEQGFDVDQVAVIRLEFQKIIRIDHLWMLKSLTKLSLAHNSIENIENLDRLKNLIELDLSFNKITKIQNLNELTKLEVLSLFQNEITKLENMDELENLVIFSVGNNLITDFKEVIYMRRFRHLRSFCIKNNPCCEKETAYDFFLSGLPKVVYLDYQLVHEEDKMKGRSIFRFVLQNLDEIDEQAEKARIAKEKYDARVEFYGLSFVEYLSGPELVETMFKRDVEGQMLLQIGGELHGYLQQYKDSYVQTMNELVVFAQDAYNVRQGEINALKNLIEGALEKSILESKRTLKTFESDKVPLLEEMKEVIQMFVHKKATLPVLEPRVLDLGDRFNDLLFSLWKNLMFIELTLFEQCEESRIQFSVNMTEQMNKLLEVARESFGKWRELDQDWSSKQMEMLYKLMGNKTLLGFIDNHSELHAIMMDRDLLMNAIAQSSDNHMRFIDAREDVLMTRASNWKDEIINGTNENEVKRNRVRVLEINFFVDNQRQDWLDMQMSLTDVVDADTMAMFSDVLDSAFDHCLK